MGFFTRSIQAPVIVQQPIKEQRDFYGAALEFNSMTSFYSSNSMRLSAVYCATTSIANSVASLPLNVYVNDSQGFKSINYQHPAQILLNIQPTKNISKFNFFKLIVSSVILKGSSYALIIRDKDNNVIEFKYLQHDMVSLSYDILSDTLMYNVVGYSKQILPQNILHFKMNTEDGVNGVSVIAYGINTLKSTQDAENHASKFFKSGGSLNGIMTTAANVDGDQITQLGLKWNQTFDKDNGGVVVLPTGLDYKPISINPVDAQLLESRQFNVIEIARFFNISPVKLFDLTNSSYSTLEQTNLDYLETTIKPYLAMIENEFNRKVFNQSEQSTTSILFDVTSMLSTDKQATATYYTTLLKNGILSVNEVRLNLGFNKISTGDENYIQLNMSTLENINKGVVAPVQETLKQKVKKDKKSIDDIQPDENN